MCSFLIIISFLYNFRPVQDYFSSYETDKSVTGGVGENPEKRLGTPTSRIWFVSPVIVRLVNWAATYDEVFIVLVMVVAKAILLFSITPFYHMLCDVASIFAVRTFVVSQAFTMVLTLTIPEYTYSCTVYHADISRAQFYRLFICKQTKRHP